MYLCNLEQTIASLEEEYIYSGGLATLAHAKHTELQGSFLPFLSKDLVHSPVMNL